VSATRSTVRFALGNHRSNHHCGNRSLGAQLADFVLLGPRQPIKQLSSCPMFSMPTIRQCRYSSEKSRKGIVGGGTVPAPARSTSGSPAPKCLRHRVMIVLQSNNEQRIQQLGHRHDDSVPTIASATELAFASFISIPVERRLWM
jgi:hypothetical protein